MDPSTINVSTALKATFTLIQKSVCQKLKVVHSMKTTIIHAHNVRILIIFNPMPLGLTLARPWTTPSMMLLRNFASLRE